MSETMNEGRHNTQELSVIVKTYDFAMWLIPAVQKFPRDFRFVLGERIESTTACSQISRIPPARRE